MNDLVIPGSVLGGAAALFGIVRYAIKSYREVQAEFATKKECVAKHEAVDVELSRRVDAHLIRDVMFPVYMTLNAVVHSQNWNVQALMMLAAEGKVTGLVPPSPIDEAEMPAIEKRFGTPQPR